jgi:hypothetical protein
MALTAQDKAKIIQAYEPILYFHPDEKFVPVNPHCQIIDALAGSAGGGKAP